MRYSGSYSDGLAVVHVFANCGTGSLFLLEHKRDGGSDFDITISSNKYHDLGLLNNSSYPTRLDNDDIILCKQIVKKLVAKLIYEITHASEDNEINADCFLQSVIHAFSSDYVVANERNDFGLTSKELKGTNNY